MSSLFGARVGKYENMAHLADSTYETAYAKYQPMKYKPHIYMLTKIRH